jgi:heat shock protein HslJ
MKNTTLSFLFLFSIFIWSCDNENEKFTCCDFEISFKKEYELTSKWSLVGIINEKPFSEECANVAGGSVIFNTNGTIGGATACNQLIGEYDLHNSKGIEVKSLGQTLRGCVGDESVYWEGKFPSELRKAERFEIEGNKLVIYTSNKTQLVFIGLE